MSTGKVALVTGASRGIGKASALALATSGFDVAVGARTLAEGEGRDDSLQTARPVPGSIETTCALVEERGARSIGVRMDLLDRSSLLDAVARVLDQWGRLDVLVNNAVHTGRGSMERFAELTIPMLETKLQANVVSQIVLIKAVLPQMLDRGSGTIVNVTSAVAVSDPPAPAGAGGWGMAYAMSKGALHRVAGILAVELDNQGILAFNVEPGFVTTERMEANQRELGFEGVYKGAPPSVPASVVAWLASSPDAAALNGQTISAQRFALENALHPDWRKR
jgi:NAD(P)-dependent dehydrogenase (short-subunit alcohol dehydrogenase family)